MSTEVQYRKVVAIVCPECETHIDAEVVWFVAQPWPIFAVTCACGYIITESEWNEV